MTADRCPVCGEPLLPRERPHGGRNARYCSGACKAKAYRARLQAGPPATTSSPHLTAAARHARAVEIRQQVGQLTGILADTASGQQALFPASAKARRPDPVGAARTLHKLIAELASLAADASVTKRVTIPHTAHGRQTTPLFGRTPD